MITRIEPEEIIISDVQEKILKLYINISSHNIYYVKYLTRPSYPGSTLLGHNFFNSS